MAEVLGKIIKVMRDSMQSAEKHNINAKLRTSAAIERIYKLIGDKIITRWLSVSCDDEFLYNKLWEELIAFLQNKVKVQQ